MMTKRFGQSGKEQNLADYIRYSRENARDTNSRKPKSKPVNATKDSKEGEVSRKWNPDKDDSSKSGDPGINTGRRKKVEDEERKRRREENRRLEEERRKREERRRREVERRRRREDEERTKRKNEEEQRRRREYEDERRREESREQEERRRREEFKARGRWGFDPNSDPESRRHRSETRGSGQLDVRLPSVRRVRSETRESEVPKRTFTHKMTDLEEDEAFQKFWRWVHNGKKNDFGVSKRLLFYDG